MTQYFSSIMQYCRVLALFFHSEFYSSRVGERYMVPQEMVVVGALVVAQYTDDHNYYRAIITAIEDLTTVKVCYSGDRKVTV